MFLLDRVELGTQSLENYVSYGGDSIAVEDTSSAANLATLLKDKRSTLIVFFQLIDRGHRDLSLVHELVVDSRPLRVCQRFLYGRGLGFLEGDHGAHVIRPESLHHLRVEA